MSLRFEICLTLAAVLAATAEIEARSPAKGNADAARPQSLSAVRSTFDDYLAKFQNMKASFQLTAVSRLGGGRIQEVDYRGDWKAHRGTHRLSFYAQAKVDGKEQWFDVKDVLIGDNSVLIWRHPGFPGNVQFGVATSREGNRLMQESQTIADPRHAFHRIHRILNHKSARLQKGTDGNLVVVLKTLDVAKTAPPGAVRTQPNDGDRLEVLLSERFGFLPTKMRRLGISEDSNSGYQSGAGLRIDYTETTDGHVVPKRIVEDRKLSDGFTGDVVREWHFERCVLNPKYEDAETQLLLPKGATAVNVDLREQFKLGADDKEKTAKLGALFPNQLRIVAPREAMRAIVKTAAGQSPDLPSVYQKLKRGPVSLVPRRSEALRITFWHGILLAVIAGLAYWRHRHHGLLRCE